MWLNIAEMRLKNEYINQLSTQSIKKIILHTSERVELPLLKLASSA